MDEEDLKEIDESQTLVYSNNTKESKIDPSSFEKEILGMHSSVEGLQAHVVDLFFEVEQDSSVG